MTATRSTIRFCILMTALAAFAAVSTQTILIAHLCRCEHTSNDASGGGHDPLHCQTCKALSAAGCFSVQAQPTELFCPIGQQPRPVRRDICPLTRISDPRIPRAPPA